MSTYNEDHKNDPKKWILHDGSRHSTAAMKQMFMGKLPSPAQRRLLGITKIAS